MFKWSYIYFLCPDIINEALTPVAKAVYDNLAVYLAWQPFELDLSLKPASDTLTKNGGQVAYRLDYSVQINSLQNAKSTDPSGTSSSPGDHFPALIGFVGFEAVRWSDPVVLKEQVGVCFYSKHQSLCSNKN